MAGRRVWWGWQAGRQARKRYVKGAGGGIGKGRWQVGEGGRESAGRRREGGSNCRQHQARQIQGRGGQCKV